MLKLFPPKHLACAIMIREQNIKTSIKTGIPTVCQPTSNSTKKMLSIDHRPWQPWLNKHFQHYSHNIFQILTTVTDLYQTYINSLNELKETNP